MGLFSSIAGSAIGKALGSAVSSYVGKDLVGDVIKGGFSLAGGLFANASARKEAQRNRNFQEDMSNTSIQRRMLDLKQAGLNPLLAVANASAGASTPAGSMAQQNNVFDPAAYAALTSARAVKQDMAIKQQQSIADLQVKQAQIENLKASSELSSAKEMQTLNEVGREQLIRQKMNIENELLSSKVLTESALRKVYNANTAESASRILLNEMQKTELGSRVAVNLQQAGQVKNVAESIRLQNVEFEKTSQARINSAYLNSARTAQEYKYMKEQLNMKRNQSNYRNLVDQADDATRISRNVIDLIPVPFVDRSNQSQVVTDRSLILRK